VEELQVLGLLEQNADLVLKTLAPLAIEGAPVLLPVLSATLKTPPTVFYAVAAAALAAEAGIVATTGNVALDIIAGLPLLALAGVSAIGGSVLSSGIKIPSAAPKKAAVPKPAAAAARPQVAARPAAAAKPVAAKPAAPKVMAAKPAAPKVGRPPLPQISPLCNYAEAHLSCLVCCAGDGCQARRCGPQGRPQGRGQARRGRQGTKKGHIFECLHTRYPHLLCAAFTCMEGLVG
jgi:hypothetical protein